MKTIHEKEKKLDQVLNELKNLETLKISQVAELDILEKQKNQLEIEKAELLTRYNSTEEENEKLKQNLEKFKQKEIDEQRKEAEFSEKIDELNQETDSLMDEIEKWQM